MNTVDWSHATGIAKDHLPAAITTYLTAHQRRDLDVALGYYTDSSTVTDEGHTYTGKAQIRDWLARSATEYTYTTALVAASKVDAEHYDAVHHLEGDFPGGVVDLHFRFSLSAGKITSLVIEP
jgi:7-keto-8-aminopelargonate synthetase-like enzyme